MNKCGSVIGVNLFDKVIDMLYRTLLLKKKGIILKFLLFTNQIST